MRSRIYLFIIILPFLLSCRSIKVEKKWRPLHNVVQKAYRSDSIWGISPNMYVDDLDEWVAQGKIEKHADMLHERVHIIREDELGLLIYLYKYYYDTEFRWREESLAFYIHIKYLLSKGWQVDKDHIASVLSGEAYGNMVSYEFAKQWIDNVVSGKLIIDIDKKYIVRE